MSLRKQFGPEYERLQAEAKVILEWQDPLFLANREKLRALWTTKGKPGLDALLDVKREWMAKLDAFASPQFPWQALEDGAASFTSLAALRDAEKLAIKIRDGLELAICTQEGYPARIENLDPDYEKGHIVGGKPSDYIVFEMNGPELAAAFRADIATLYDLFSKIKTKPGAEKIHIVEPAVRELANGPGKAETAFNVFGLDVDRQPN